MKQLEIVIQNPTGLHARPAKVFVNLAKQYTSDIRVQHGEKKANAKSMISMLTLGAERGSQIRVMVDGEDEDAAIQAIEAAIREGLGEGEELGEKPTAPLPTLASVSAELTAAGLTEHLIKGIPAAPGIVIGPVYQLKRSEITLVETEYGTPAEEQARLQDAIGKARSQLKILHNQLTASQAGGEAAIFEVHLEMLDDADLLEAVQVNIQNKQSAAQAWQSIIDERAQAVAALKDPLLSARAADLHDVGYRVLRLLMGAGEQVYTLPDHPVVVIARDLSPSDTASLDRTRVLGFCTAGGGPTSHTAIIARALSLPAMVSAGEGVLELQDETTVILNGEAGTLAVDPSQGMIEAARDAGKRWLALRSAAKEKAVEPAITLDGHRVEVVANIGSLKDAQEAMKNGAEGVGLLRTEFLFLDRPDAPTEREQFEVYSSIVKTMENRPVVLRTLDVGGDKPLPYVEAPHEENPFLGVRGIRLCLGRPDLFREQLRAVLRAAEFGRLLVMFPMVADISEVRQARAIVEELRIALNAPKIDIGIMIEVPSAALMADVIAPEVDFFSIGTNDLTQYTLAMDRMHPSLAGKSDGLHPAVLRLIARTVEAAHKHGKWVGICGELGGDPQAIPILVGLGVDELSISVPSIPTAKALVRTLKMPEAQALAQRALNCATSAEVREIVRMMKEGI